MPGGQQRVAPAMTARSTAASSSATSVGSISAQPSPPSGGASIHGSDQAGQALGGGGPQIDGMARTRERAVHSVGEHQDQSAGSMERSGRGREVGLRPD